MCGIVGCWHSEPQHPVSREILIEMRDQMMMRGPDDKGVWIDGSIGFGHRRLSILDLSPRGHQPMIDPESGCVICYNGEVYNFKLIKRELETHGLHCQSRTDTEVILKAYTIWGERCVERFIGMFAFAIWDPKRKTLFLARDRMGIKPLYYYYDEKIFLFASRLGALIRHPACPKDIDVEALGLYLELGFLPAPWSILTGVRKLLPGHTLCVDAKGLHTERYWRIDSIAHDSSCEKRSEEELIEQLDALLRESIKLRMISDVPLGAFLSGGIDSSTVVALMCQMSDSIPKTFTIGFKETGYNEADYARNVARYLGTEHREIVMDSCELLALLDEQSKYYDEPFADWSTLPTMLVSRLAREDVTVCLSGDGGDELFAGYQYYTILSQIRHLYKFPRIFRTVPGTILTALGAHKLVLLGQLLKQSDLTTAFAYMRSTIKDYDRSALLPQKSLLLHEVFSSRSQSFPPLDEVSKACLLDIIYYLADDILQKVDVASMSTSLEARVPILDYRVVEFAQALPLGFKLRHGSTKWLLRQVLSRYVPESLFNRPKCGFSMPIKHWFRDELKEMVQDELAPSRVKRFGYLQLEGVQRLLDLHLSGRRNTHPMLWLLLSLFRWDEYIRQPAVITK